MAVFHVILIEIKAAIKPEQAYLMLCPDFISYIHLLMNLFLHVGWENKGDRFPNVIVRYGGL